MEFNSEKPNVLDCAAKVMGELKTRSAVIVVKHIKSGAKLLIKRLANDMNLGQVHYYCTSLSRNDTKSQLEEYRESRMIVVNTSRRVKPSVIKRLGGLSIEEAKESIAKDFKNDMFPVIHFDESDYGTGKDQSFSKFFDFIKENKNKLKIILYSATNTEAEGSDLLRDEFNASTIEFIPGEGFIGPREFLAQGRVFDAEPFFDLNNDGSLSLGEQAKEILHKFKDDTKNFIGIVRLATVSSSKDDSDCCSISDTKPNKDNKKLFPSFEKDTELVKKIENDYNLAVVFVDSKRLFEWNKSAGSENSYTIMRDRYSSRKIKTLLVINQTCTRSTEITFLDEVAFLHDYRTSGTHRNTRVQAFERTNHYLCSYSTPPNTISYTSILDFMLSDGKISLDFYFSGTGVKSFSNRVGYSSKPVRNNRVWWHEYKDSDILTIEKGNSVSKDNLYFSVDGKNSIKLHKNNLADWNTKNSEAGGGGVNDPTYRIIKGVPRNSLLRDDGSGGVYDSFIITGSAKGSAKWGELLALMGKEKVYGSNRTALEVFNEDKKVIWVVYSDYAGYDDIERTLKGSSVR